MKMKTGFQTCGSVSILTNDGLTIEELEKKYRVMADKIIADEDLLHNFIMSLGAYNEDGSLKKMFITGNRDDG